MCIFVYFSGHCLSFHQFTVNCHSRHFKIFYLERNLYKKCSENENEVQFCARHPRYVVRDWFLGWGRSTLKLASQQRLGSDVVRVSFFISFMDKNKKPVSVICGITPILEKKHSSDALTHWHRLECWPPHTEKKPFNPLPMFTVSKMESSACICRYGNVSI